MMEKEGGMQDAGGQRCEGEAIINSSERSEKALNNRMKHDSKIDSLSLGGS